MTSEGRLVNLSGLLLFLRTATVEQRLDIGRRLIKDGTRGIFKLTIMFYAEPNPFTCAHVAPFAPLFQAMPQDWFDESWDKRLEHRRFVRPVTEFDIMHADARCDDCQHHAGVLVASELPPEWQKEKLKEMGFLK